MTYDSTDDTLKHISEVRILLAQVIVELQNRITTHDKSKLEAPEKEIFDRVTPKLRTLTYGSPEYHASLEEMGPALDHHYSVNSHHPEHHEDGIHGMSLVDLIEMLADWKAATLRHDDAVGIVDGRVAWTWRLPEPARERATPVAASLAGGAAYLVFDSTRVAAIAPP